MEKSMSPRKSRRQCGFTLVETMVAILVLTIGLFSVAALMSSTLNMSAHARYMSTAALLGSEKLEDLSRLPNTDSALAAGTYNDTVEISSNNGNIVETTTAGGVTTLYTQTPGGNITVTPGGSMPAVTKDTLTFNRQWTIAANTPISGVRQITVLVTLTNQSLKPPVTFQTSTVHP
jgi:type IV pilus modification protein PilV